MTGTNKQERKAAPRINFTESAIEKLPFASDGERVTYHDDDLRGLQLRVSSGAKVFYVFARPRAGRPERIRIGPFPTVSVRRARDEAKKMLGDLATAANPAEARRKVRGELTLGELFEIYIADREKAGKRSTGDYRAMWELYLGKLPEAPPKRHGKARTKPADGVDWTNRRLSEISRTQVSALHSRIAKRKPYVANRVQELLRAMYAFAMKHEYATANPADGITQAPEKERSRFLGADELQLLIGQLKKEEPLWRDYFTTLLYVGYRRSAVAAMRWHDIDLEAGTWGVPGESAKNGDPIILPLTGPALEVLKRRSRDRESRDWVFPGRSGAGHLTQPKKAWKRVVEGAGLKDLRIHDLRRTLGSWMAMSGKSLLEIGRALGHKDQRSTQIYARLQIDAVKDAVSVAHKAMRAALTNPKVVPLRRARA